MRHAALEFLDLLDPSLDARFNIETYPDGGKKQESFRLIHHFPAKSLSEVEGLIPTLQSLNAKGAAIYIAVNQFKGQRKLENLDRVRGIHADLDSASGEQLTRLQQVLAPTIVVRSSRGHKQHWYWLLADGEELSAERAKLINQSITAFGCDKGATDLARLLRLPGFYNLKPKNQIKGEGKATSTPPMVTILEHRQRYSSEEILAAFPTVQAEEKIPLKKRLSPTPTKPINPSSLIEKAASFYETHEPILWSGRWQDYSDPLTGQKPFESQSSADYALCRRIGYWALENGVPTAELPSFVEDVFSASGLANRDKWQERYDYRDRTIAAACTGLKQRDSLFQELSRKIEPDWSLKGDLIASRFFGDLLGEQMKFIVSVGKWIRWDTTRQQWRWCELGEEVEATKRLVLELRRLAHIHAANHPETGVKLTNEIGGLQREPRIRAVIELAKSEPGISLEPKDLDAHPDLIGVRNGVIDLRTGNLAANKPELLITKYIDIEYDKDASCPLFKDFLNQVFENDADTVDAIHRLTGLTMTGRTGEEVIVFCVGTGANGKSIFGNILTSILGQYAVTAPSSLLASRRSDDHGARSDLAMLRGNRLVSINELPGGMTLDETVTKQLAGREPITARFLHKEFFTFEPQFTPWVRTNHRPIIKGTDNGIWRRIVIVPFKRTFSLAEQDKNLEGKLSSERPGILAWLVQGAMLYLKNGLQKSQVMREQLSEYRTDSDLLGEFLADHTIEAPYAETKQSTLFLEYSLWCERNGLRPISRRVLTEQLRERGIRQRKSGSVRYYTGVCLEPPQSTMGSGTVGRG